MKKILSIMVILSILCVSLVTPSFAKTSTEIDMTESEMNKKLKEIGFSREQIHSLKYETKKDIFKDCVPKKLLSYEKDYLKVNADGQLKSIKSTDGIISPMSLTTNDLSLTVATIELSDINGLPAVKLLAQYEWIDDPFWELHDQLAITWSPGWYAHTYGLTHYWEDDYFGNTLSEAGDKYDENKNGGIVFEFDLKHTKNWGSAYVKLLANNQNLIEESTYSAGKVRYAHDTYKPNISLGISYQGVPGVSAGITMDGATEYLDKPISWRNSTILD